MTRIVAAFGPASIGNVGVGFDMLGIALEGVGDRVIARRVEKRGVCVAEVRGLDGEIHPYLSADPRENTASIAAQALWNHTGAQGGVELKVLKGVPLQSGMGSSAASAVAGAVAANALLDQPLPKEKLLPFALEGEKYASGGLHADNIAVLDKGQLVATGTHEELMQSCELYQRLASLQFRDTEPDNAKSINYPAVESGTSALR